MKVSQPNLSPTSLFFWLLAAFSVSIVYLVVSFWGNGVFGFPLDDAWIHQTYARNLAHSGQLAFTPGVPSAGSTAPLWSFLLSLGYLLGLPFKFWTYGLGILCLGLTGWTVTRLGWQLFPESRWVGFWAGLFCILEWHHTWAALSGMETLLFIWLSLFLVERYLASQSASPPSPHFYLGLLGGALILTRPEGVGLVGLIGVDMARRQWPQRQKQPDQLGYRTLWVRWLGLVGGAGVLVLPYLVFHLWMTGLPLPNTFYAKQAEYGLILDSFPLWWRLFGNIGPTIESVQGVFRVIFIGPQLLLLPGLFFAAWLTLKQRRFELLLIWLWWVSYLTLYALRLPVTYQHGRYQIPAIVWVILLGMWGTERLFASQPRAARQKFLLRLAGRVVSLSLILVTVGFIFLGVQAYRRDVHFIETEMVATAKWLKGNTAPDALIAAHDIGAIGYFSQRPLIDLAGLITPEVIPIIRDETALLNFILTHRAAYLVTFPSWYPRLTKAPMLEVRYPLSDETRADPMTVYQITLP